jgi:hypothetical protein
VSLYFVTNKKKIFKIFPISLSKNSFPFEKQVHPIISPYERKEILQDFKFRYSAQGDQLWLLKSSQKGVEAQLPWLKMQATPKS